VRNVATDRDSASLSLYRDNGLVSYVGLPLVARDEALGVLNVYSREERDFGAEEIDFLMTLAGQAAMAIHNAQLHEQTQQHLKRIEGVSEINNAIASTLSLKNVIDILLEKIEKISPFAVACGFLTRRLETWFHWPPAIFPSKNGGKKWQTPRVV